MSDWDDFCSGMGWANDEYAADKLYDLIENGYKKEQESELLKQGYKTVKEWNAIGRSVKKGEKGSYLPYSNTIAFSEDQTSPTKLSCNSKRLECEKNLFDTYEKAISWAKENPGKAITRSADGKSFTVK